MDQAEGRRSTEGA